MAAANLLSKTSTIINHPNENSFVPKTAEDPKSSRFYIGNLRDSAANVLFCFAKHVCVALQGSTCHERSDRKES
jgi:hypothetical protein